MKLDAKTITVNGVDYAPVGTQIQHEGDIKIIILQRGWVMIGRLERNGSECKLHDSHVINHWGTTEGLGELAHKGCLPETKLNKNYGIVEFDYLTVVASIACSEEAWKNVL